MQRVANMRGQLLSASCLIVCFLSRENPTSVAFFPFLQKICLFFFENTVSQVSIGYTIDFPEKTAENDPEPFGLLKTNRVWLNSIVLRSRNTPHYCRFGVENSVQIDSTKGVLRFSLPHKLAVPWGVSGSNVRFNEFGAAKSPLPGRSYGSISCVQWFQ